MSNTRDGGADATLEVMQGGGKEETGGNGGFWLMAPLCITVVGAVCAAVMAGIKVGGAEVTKEDEIAKVEAREEERMLGWRDACAWGKIEEERWL